MKKPLQSVRLRRQTSRKPQVFAETPRVEADIRQGPVQVDVLRTHISTFSLFEPFDVGRDNEMPVSPLYHGVFPFSGVLDRVVFEMID